ncbi:hypothetical protein DFH08DRAFT_822446 [Mycena albidolilacea]|uniref:Aminotransferase class V domain-containing protein n=1 Tax=Mycena albidolilacea TaxID=1033008 RepID=A0AAD6Z908_9AGAR|nr:hypothetical protein DFH08DRAFT_822446 [Mycena albidolilacea]
MEHGFLPYTECNYDNWLSYRDGIMVSRRRVLMITAHAAQFISDIPPHPAVSKITLKFPTMPAQVITKADQKTVAIIDSIISVPGILLPWKEMVQVLQTEGVMSVIDAAHSIGQEINLDLNTADPDFWTSGPQLSSFSRISVSQQINVQLPLPPSLQTRAVMLGKLKKKLIFDRNTFALVFFLEGMGWWIRCSAQVWTESGDFEKLGKAPLAVCPEIVQELYADEAELKSRL